MKLIKRMFNFTRAAFVNACGFVTGSAASIFALFHISTKAARVAEGALVASGFIPATSIPVAIQAASLIAPVIAERCGVFKQTYNFGAIPGECAATASVYVAGGIAFGTQAAITHAFNRVAGTFSGWIFNEPQANLQTYQEPRVNNIPVAEIANGYEITVCL